MHLLLQLHSHELSHFLGHLLHFRGDVGVGIQREAGRTVPQYSREGPDIPPLCRGSAAEG